MLEREQLVSVVLPTYNRLAYLRQAVQSVLDQTYRRWELIVVDDGSTDGTAEYLASLGTRVRVLTLAGRGGAARARNAGVGAARGAYVAFLDSDDVWLPEKLAMQVAGLRAQSRCRWSYTFFRRINDDGEEIPLPAGRRWVACEGWILEELITVVAWVATPAVVAERSLLSDVGGFDESLESSEDYDLWLRLARRSEVALVPRALVAVRQHRDNLWRAEGPAVRASWVRVYERLLADPGLRGIHSLCRRQWVLANVSLADRHRGDGHYLAAVRRLLYAAPSGLTLLGWWRALAKTLLRPIVPARVRRRFRRGPARAGRGVA